MNTFKVGEIVEHVLNREWLLILEANDETYICRTKNLSVEAFYEFELRERKPVQ